MFRFFKAINFIALLSSALIVIGTTIPQLESRTPCGNISDAVGLRRLFSQKGQDHFYTYSIWDQLQYDLGPGGYVVETLNAGLYFETQEPGTVPLLRLYNNATITHLYTTSQALRSMLINIANPPYADDGPLGGISRYVYTDGSCPGTVPLYWATSTLLTDNYYTVSISEYNAFIADGYSGQGIVAWIYPPS